MKNTLIIILLFFSNSYQVFSQIDEFRLSEKLIHEVKQLNQFLARFNHQEDIEGKAIAVSNSEERSQYIAALFDLQYLDRLDKAQKETLRTFIEEVTSKPSFLNFEDKGWYAEVTGVIDWYGKEQQMKLLMSVEGDKKKGMKWVISDAYLPFLKEKVSQSKHEPMIPPNSNETNFIALGKVLEKGDEIENLIAQNYTGHHLQQFLAEVKAKKVAWKYAKKVSYHFLQIDGWVISVDWFERDSKNAGWLISNISPLSNSYKPAYPSLLLHQP